MPESRAREMPVRLPRPLEDEVERARERDPEALNRIVAYGVTRRVIFDHLVARGGVEESAAELRY